jgi:hypothetical protein
VNASVGTAPSIVAIATRSARRRTRPITNPPVGCGHCP